MAHLHFIPKPHKPDTPLRPIVAAIHAPATEISKFLNDLLAPIFLRVARQTTFINERKLRNNKIGTLRIDDIMRMARLVLDTNIFAYENKYYRQIRDGVMGSAFTQTLANIYMLDWEQQLMHDQQAGQEIYGRYIDDVFMTTNLTHDQIKVRLDNAHRKDPNIRISYSIQSTIDFLDVTVNNEHGHLKTSIFHKSAAEPYVLPYTSDHPRHVFRNIPYAALLRAARICSNVEDFDMERIRIDLSLLLNEYPPSFISKHFHRFFEINQTMAVFERLDSQIVEYQSKVFFNTKLMTDPDRNIERDIDRFDDIFHRFDDDIDEEEDTNIDFDNLYMNIGKDNNNDVIEIEQLNDDKNNLIDSVFKEENLSQKLSQLSATDKEQEDSDKSKPSTVKKRPTLTPSTTTDNISKKMKPDKEESTSNQIPRYLSSHNKAFEQMINPILEKTTTTSINIEYLREIAILIHQLECIDLDILLWTTYLRSGTGTLKPQATTSTLLLWPLEVKQRMIDRGQTTASDPNEIDHASCLNYVQRVLQKFRNQTEHYQAQLKERKKRLNNCWTCEIGEAITKFVQRHVTPIYKVPTEGQIAIVQYDYNDRLIQLEYYQQNPNEYQKQIFENLTQAKYEKETSKFDVAILKQRIVYNHLPQSFESLKIPPPISFDTITDTMTCQRLKDRCEKILQRTKSEMMMIYITTAEAKMNEYEKKFDTDLAKMKENQCSGPSHKKLTQTMLNIMERRFQNINERLTCLYKLKLRFFVKAPTEQVTFLNRGPTYVPPCQIHILSKSSLILAQIVTKQMAPLQRELAKLFIKYPIDLSRQMHFENGIEQLFNESFLQPMPSVLEERALYEKQLILSIRYQLNKDQLILRRTADEMNTYYLGRLNEFNQKSNEYIQNSTCYELIETINEINTEQQQLEGIIQSIDLQLEILYQRKLIKEDHLIRLSIGKKTNINLPYLYFLPETNENVHMSVQPRLSSCQHCPIYTLATYLNQLLRPLFDNFSR
ncbi:unnamed protein product, partial [Rotaria sordida]